MKKKFLISFIAVLSGILFTFLFLNNNIFYAKEEYSLYAFQIGAYKDLDNANKMKDEYNGVIYEEDGLYKVLVGIYKDIDVLNKMLVYFENNNINIYLKSIKVSKNLYNKIDDYEKLISSSNSEKLYIKVNESILKLYEKDIEVI